MWGASRPQALRPPSFSSVSSALEWGLLVCPDAAQIRNACFPQRSGTEATQQGDARPGTRQLLLRLSPCGLLRSPIKCLSHYFPFAARVPHPHRQRGRRGRMWIMESNRPESKKLGGALELRCLPQWYPSPPTRLTGCPGELVRKGKERPEVRGRGNGGCGDSE